MHKHVLKSELLSYVTKTSSKIFWLPLSFMHYNRELVVALPMNCIKNNSPIRFEPWSAYRDFFFTHFALRNAYICTQNYEFSMYRTLYVPTVDHLITHFDIWNYQTHVITLILSIYLSIMKWNELGFLSL